MPCRKEVDAAATIVPNTLYAWQRVLCVAPERHCAMPAHCSALICVREPMMTWAPATARALAVSKPRPWLPPVTKTVCARQREAVRLTPTLPAWPFWNPSCSEIKLIFARLHADGSMGSACSAYGAETQLATQQTAYRVSRVQHNSARCQRQPVNAHALPFMLPFSAL